MSAKAELVVPAVHGRRSTCAAIFAKRSHCFTSMFYRKRSCSSPQSERLKRTNETSKQTRVEARRRAERKTRGCRLQDSTSKPLRSIAPFFSKNKAIHSKYRYRSDAPGFVAFTAFFWKFQISVQYPFNTPPKSRYYSNQAPHAHGSICCAINL